MSGSFSPLSSAPRQDPFFDAIEQNGAPILFLTPHGGIEYANQGFLDLTGYPVERLIGQPFCILLEQTQCWSSLFEQLTAGRNWRGDVWCRHSSHRLFLLHLSVSPIRHREGNILRYCCFGEDVTQLRENHREMERMALQDSLTGLSNRRHLLDRLEHALLAGQRYGRFQALLFLDLDGFKQVNDHHGHEVGDCLLREIACRLLETVRAEDTVARLGGDEFVILLEKADGPEAVALVALKILRCVAEPVTVGTLHLQVSTSIGIALSSMDGETSECLLKNADKAMYQAKAEGRNCYHFFTPQLNQSLHDREKLAEDLAHALAKDQFELYFHPWVEMSQQRIAGIEALLRWNHPHLGQLRPAAFIALAERLEMILPLGYWILRQVAAYLADLKKLGLGNVPVSVNLSGRQLLDPNLISVITELLEAYAFNPTNLELEVSEVILTDHTRQATQTLLQLKALGISLVLDDFGAGRLSTRELAALRLDRVKVDPRFINQGNASPDIASAMIAMAHKLNMAVVAEGVETMGQFDRLAQNRCDFAQGYYFYEPQDLAHTTRLLGRVGQFAESA